jgi:outer membrane protein assembly factor BamD (BamD/ComL family)
MQSITIRNKTPRSSAALRRPATSAAHRVGPHWRDGRLTARMALVAACLATCGGCSTWQSLGASMSPAALLGDATVGSPQWWSRHKSSAEFVPGAGFRVAGVDGFFDGNGRPVAAPIAPVVAEEKEESVLGEYDPKSAYNRVLAAVGRGPNETEAQRLFNEGRDLYAKKQYAAAADRLKTAAARWPGSELEEDALFLRGESLFFDDEYPDANDAYLELIKAHPNTKHLDTAISRQASIARYWQQKHQQDAEWPITPNFIDETRPWFDTVGHAIRTYDNIRMNDPTGPLADDALMASANAYFFRGRYDDADYHYELLRREYPKSDYQYEAHLLGLQCKLRKYQGPEYDAAPLREAERLIKQLRVQFAYDLKDDERRRIDEIEARINQNWAARDWQMAQFYEGRSQYGSARYYYDQIVDAYPQTEIAERARTRLAAIAEQPAVPEEKLGWLMQYLPESKEQTLLAIPMRDAPVRR